MSLLEIDQRAKISRDEAIVACFQKYARGRINYFARRQILTIIGSGFVGLLMTPMLGLLAAIIALFGEVIDCLCLKWALIKMENQVSIDTIIALSTVTAGIQSISISICILMAQLLPTNGLGVHFALVF